MLTRNFSLVEFGCRDGTPVPAELIPSVQRLAVELQKLRNHLGEPIRVNSAYRTAAHNLRVGGKETSRHRTGEAADIVIAGVSPNEIREHVIQLIRVGKMRDGGIGLYPGFLHYDLGKPRRW